MVQGTEKSRRKSYFSPSFLFSIIIIIQMRRIRFLFPSYQGHSLSLNKLFFFETFVSINGVTKRQSGGEENFSTVSVQAFMESYFGIFTNPFIAN